MEKLYKKILDKIDDNKYINASYNVIINGKPLIFMAIVLKRIKLLVKMIDVKTNLNIFTYPEKLTPLSTAIYMNNIDIVKILVENNVDINKSVEKDDISPLMIASEMNNKDIVIILLNNKADINYVNTEGESAFKLSIINKSYDVFNYLLNSKIDINYKFNNDETLLTITIENNDKYLVDLLLKKKSDINYCKGFNWRTPVVLSVQNNSTNVIKSLVEGKSDIDGKDDGLSPLFFSIINDYEECFNILIELGANPNKKSRSKDSKGFITPLHISVAENSIKYLELLIENDADVNMMSSFNDETPLYIASYMNNYECLEILINNKANPDILKRETKLSAINIAVKDSDCYKLLLKEKNKRKLMKSKEYLYDNCPICLEKMNDGGEIEVTNCYHGFHKSCWRKYNKDICPICRGKAIS